MPELPLDNDQRHALVCELYSVSMSELMGREASTDAGRFRRSAQLFARCRRFPAPPCRRAMQHAEQRANR